MGTHVWKVIDQSTGVLCIIYTLIKHYESLKIVKVGLFGVTRVPFRLMLGFSECCPSASRFWGCRGMCSLWMLGVGLGPKFGTPVVWSLLALLASLRRGTRCFLSPPRGDQRFLWRLSLSLSLLANSASRCSLNLHFFDEQ